MPGRVTERLDRLPDRNRNRESQKVRRGGILQESCRRGRCKGGSSQESGVRNHGRGALPQTHGKKRAHKEGCLGGEA